MVEKKVPKSGRGQAYRYALTNLTHTSEEVGQAKHLFDLDREAFLLLGSKDPKAQVLLNLLTEQMRGQALIVSREALAELLGWSVRTVSYKIKVLIQNGFIHVLKTGSSNIYYRSTDCDWSRYGNGQEYSRLEATVLIARSEQGSDRKEAQDHE